MRKKNKEYTISDSPNFKNLGWLSLGFVVFTSGIEVTSPMGYHSLPVKIIYWICLIISLIFCWLKAYEGLTNE